MLFDYFFNLFIFNGDFNVPNEDSYRANNSQSEAVAIEFKRLC